jgi:uncharacterized protein (UPF0332 family)
VTELPVAGAEEELGLARETLEAAHVLAAAGLHRHAVGRAYYAIFHAACALLVSIGLRARTHEGLRSLINEHFVRPGKLDPEHARAFRQTAGDRTDADYDASATFSAEDSQADIARADAFVEAVVALVAPPPSAR